MARMVLAFDVTAILVALLTGSALTAVLGYAGKRLLASGRVRTTDADKLWEQESRIREHLERDNQRLRGEFDGATGQIFELRARVVDLGATMTRGSNDLRRVRANLRDARAENDVLREENRRLRAQIGGES